MVKSNTGTTTGGFYFFADDQFTADIIEGGEIEETTINTLNSTEINVGNLKLSGNTIEVTDTDGDLILESNGTGSITLNGIAMPGGGTIDLAHVEVLNQNLETKVDIKTDTAVDYDIQIAAQHGAGTSSIKTRAHDLEIYTPAKKTKFYHNVELTTTDINGGTIDGTTIGGSTAAAGTFTDCTTNGGHFKSGDGHYISEGAFVLDSNNVDKNNGVIYFRGIQDGAIGDFVDFGTISSSGLNGMSVTVGTGKTLNVSAGTLTLADNQISGDKVEGGTIDSITLTSADINGGTIDGTTIGGNTPAAGTFTDCTTNGGQFTAGDGHYISEGPFVLDSNNVDKNNGVIYFRGIQDGAIGDFVDFGTISSSGLNGMSVTVGTGKTLNVSAGTLTLADNQISGDKVEGGTIDSITLTSADINGGTIDGTTIGATTPNAATFTTLTTDNINIDGNTIISIDTDGDINLTPNGTGSIVQSKVDINGGVIDGTSIGISIPSSGQFSDCAVNTNGGATALIRFYNGNGIRNWYCGQDINDTGYTIRWFNGVDFWFESFKVDSLGNVTIPGIFNSNSVKALTFDTNVDAAGVTLSGTSLVADGNDTDIDINITPKGTGSVVLSKSTLTTTDINGGTIDGTTIGATTPSTGTFTTLNATTLNATNLNYTNQTYSTNDPITISATNKVIVYEEHNGVDFDSPITINLTEADYYIDSLCTEITNKMIAGSGQTYTWLCEVGTGGNVEFSTQEGPFKIDFTQPNAPFAELGFTAFYYQETGIAPWIIGGATVPVTDGTTLSGNSLTAQGDETNIDIDLVPKGTGSIVQSKVDINGGTIDGTTIGATTPDSGKFTVLDIDNININGNTIISTDTDGDINLTPNGTGSINLSKSVLTTTDINGGTIDGTTIGATTPSTAIFTDLNVYKDGPAAIVVENTEGSGTLGVADIATNYADDSLAGDTVLRSDGNRLLLTTGTSGNSAIIIDSSQNVTIPKLIPTINGSADSWFPEFPQVDSYILNSNNCYYTKIANLVFCHIDIDFSGTSNELAEFYFNNLPYDISYGRSNGWCRIHHTGLVISCTAFVDTLALTFVPRFTSNSVRIRDVGAGSEGAEVTLIQDESAFSCRLTGDFQYITG
jgi:hypothetical protein